MQIIFRPTIVSLVSIALFVTGVITVLKTRLTIKKFITYFVMLVALGAFVCININQLFIGMAPSPVYHIFSLIPFGNFIFTGVYDLDSRMSFQIQFYTFYAQSFLISLIWGVGIPYISKHHGLLRTAILEISILFPINIILMLCCYFGYSQGSVFDTGSYILVILGAVLGWNIHDAISSRKRKEDT